MMHIVRRGLVAALGILATGALTSTALAVENQQHIAVAPSLALLKTADTPVAAGIGFGAMYSYGLRDQINLLAELSASTHTVNHEIPDGAKAVPLTRPSLAARASVGAAYVLDVLRWVPYGGLLLSGAYLSGGTMPNAKVVPNIELALGLDYQFNRQIVAGVAYRQSFFISQLSTYPSYSNVFFKLEYQWGH